MNETNHSLMNPIRPSPSPSLDSFRGDVRDPERTSPLLEEGSTSPQDTTTSSVPSSSSSSTYSSKCAHHFHDVPDDKEASSALSEIVSAIEAGDVTLLESLLDAANIHIDIANKHGETPLHLASGLGQADVIAFLARRGARLDAGDGMGDAPLHWAARQGHADAAAALIQHGAQINAQNKHGESCLHVACRYGHTVVVQNLCLCNMNIDLQDDHGETALHVAAWHGFPQIAHHLCSAAANTELVDKDSQSALHVACSRGHLECARCLVSSGSCVDAQEARGLTGVMLALRTRHVQTALLLLHAGANTDITDENGDAAIHVCAREGLLTAAQTLCAFGCAVDAQNAAGQSPLHIAAKQGQVEIVRCLSLAGCRVEQKNRHGVLSEISAMANGHEHVADLLASLRNEQHREDLIQQLIPSSTPLARFKVKLLGHSGSGKTALLASLRAGYFSSLFRRAKGTTSFTHHTVNTSSLHSRSDQAFREHIEMEPATRPRQHSISLDLPTGHNYTKGIDVQQVHWSGVGDVSAWEFSGRDAYLCVYDHFLGSAMCAHLVLVSLELPFEVQLLQAAFWMSLLQARLPPVEPLGFAGHPRGARCHVTLVATHADAAARGDAQGEFAHPDAPLLREKLSAMFGSCLHIHETVFVLDATAAGSTGVKALKSYLSQIKSRITTEDAPRVTGFLTALATAVAEWRVETRPMPVIPWKAYVEDVRERVNCLAGEEHVREATTQLQLMGEVVVLRAAPQELVVLDPAWLTNRQVGQLLSAEYIKHAKVTGCYTVDDFQMSFPDCDALDLLQVLEALHLCTQCENDGDFEWEFPFFNAVETLEGLWERRDPRYEEGVYVGVALLTPEASESLTQPIFTRIQVQLRRSWQEYPESDTDLYQWRRGSKFCSGPLEALLTFEDGESEMEGGRAAVEVKARGPPSAGAVLFFFLEDILAIVDQVMLEMCPGLMLERHVLSSQDLRDHIPRPYRWTPSHVLKEVIAHGAHASLTNACTGRNELFSDLVCLGSQQVLSCVAVGGEVAASGALSTATLQRLASLLDPPHPRGADWCVLAVKLGMESLLPSLDDEGSAFERGATRTSPTAAILQSWARKSDATVGALLSVLRLMGREDAAETLLSAAPLYLLTASGGGVTDEGEGDDGGTGSGEGEGEEEEQGLTPPVSSTSSISR